VQLSVFIHVQYTYAHTRTYLHTEDSKRILDVAELHTNTCMESVRTSLSFRRDAELKTIQEKLPLEISELLHNKMVCVSCVALMYMIMCCSLTLLTTVLMAGFLSIRIFAMSSLCGSCCSRRLRCAICPMASKDEGMSTPFGSNFCSTCKHTNFSAIRVSICFGNICNFV
jgi:hypothetical protein